MQHNEIDLATPYIYNAPGATALKGEMVKLFFDNQRIPKNDKEQYENKILPMLTQQGELNVFTKAAIFTPATDDGMVGMLIKSWELQLTLFSRAALECITRPPYE